MLEMHHNHMNYLLLKSGFIDMHVGGGGRLVAMTFLDNLKAFSIAFEYDLKFI